MTKVKPTSSGKTVSSRETVKGWAILAGDAANSKLGQDTEIFEVGEVIGICDYFVITSGSNPRQVKAISEAIEESLKKEVGIKPTYIEGLPEDWLLMDYGDIVIHIFSDAARQYYNLGRLWRDCPQISIS